MTEDWVLTTLAPVIVTIGGAQYVQFPVSSGAPNLITPSGLAAIFATAATPLTAASLNAVDAGKLGYATAIAAWQEAGYIPAA